MSRTPLLSPFPDRQGPPQRRLQGAGPVEWGGGFGPNQTRTRRFGEYGSPKTELLAKAEEAARCPTAGHVPPVASASPPAALRPHLQNCDLLSRIFITTDEASKTLRLALRQSQVRQPGMAAETDGGALGSIGCPASSRGRPGWVRTLPGLPTLPALAGGGVGRSSQCLALSAVPRHKPDRPYRSSVDRRHLPPHSHG